MLTVMEAIVKRRSIRRFRSDPVAEEAIAQILEAARLAPSGTNRQPWRFLVVTEPDERKALRAMCYKQSFVEQAPVVFICCADLNTYSNDLGRKRLQELSDSGIELSGSLSSAEHWEKNFRENEGRKLASFLSTARANVYIAIEHMALMAAALGLGSCWVGAMENPAEIAAYFGIADNIVPVALLPVGHPAISPPPVPRLTTEQMLLRPLNVK